MKFCILYISFWIVYCNGLLFDSCQTNADCPSGCCLAGGVLGLGHSCHHNYLALHHTCHLNGQETTSCGCASGSACVPSSTGSTTIGHCELQELSSPPITTSSTESTTAFTEVSKDTCQTNADCPSPSRCCLAGTIGNSCHANYLPFNHSCHLTGHGRTICECEQGLVCVPIPYFGTGSAPSQEYGVCDMSNITTLPTDGK